MYATGRQQARSGIAALLIALLVSSHTVLAQPARIPDHTGIDILSGRPVNFSDFRGKVLFVDFWASWCPPCLLSLPAYQRIHTSLDPEEFALVAINVDEDTADALVFLEEHPVSYPVLADPEGQLGIPLGIRALPMSYLVDRQGNIVEEFRSFREGDEVMIKEKIDALLTRDKP